MSNYSDYRLFSQQSNAQNYQSFCNSLNNSNCQLRPEFSQSQNQNQIYNQSQNQNMETFANLNRQFQLSQSQQQNPQYPNNINTQQQHQNQGQNLAFLNDRTYFNKYNNYDNSQLKNISHKYNPNPK
jgi:hypothetical protein